MNKMTEFLSYIFSFAVEAVLLIIFFKGFFSIFDRNYE